MADSHDPHGEAAHGTGHSVWNHVSPDDRHALVAEDSQAWRGVTGLLLTIVIGGVMLGILGVVIAALAT
jgi:hypothetical protein